jgi:uroporphyrinogen-III decarboxylase
MFVLNEKAMQMVKARYPEVPIIYFANGGSSYLHSQLEGMQCDVIGLDQYISMDQAMQQQQQQQQHIIEKHSHISSGSKGLQLGGDRRHVLMGNMDPAVLFTPEERIRQEVCVCE